MNLKEFQIKHEASDHYVIQHPKGKEITVKKKGLSEKSHSLIKELPKFAEGGEVEESSDIPPYLQPNPPEVGRDAAAKYFMNDESSLLPTPANAEEIIKTQPVVGKSVSGNMSQNINDNDLIRKATQAGMTVDEFKNKMPEFSDKPSENPAPVAPAIPPPEAPQDGANALAQKQQSLLGTLESQKTIQSELGQAEAAQHKAEADQIDKVQSKIDLMQTQQDLVNQYKVKDDNFAKMLDAQKIDPQRYYKNQTTGQKVMQGIALVLGGIGSGLTGQPNAALGIIKDRIDQDIESQKNDQSKTMNLWKMNREMLGNDLAANLATQNQLYTGLKYNLQKEAAKAASPIAKYRSDLAVNEIDQKIAQNRMTQSMIQIGLGQAGGKAQGADPAALVPHLVPPEKQKDVFDEIQNAQNIHREKQHLLEAFDAAAKDVRPMSGGHIRNAIPGVTSPYVKSFHLQVGPTISKLEKSVRDTIMQNIENNATPQFADDENTIAIKRKAFEHYMDSAASAPTAKGYGIDLSKFRSTTVDPLMSLDPKQRQYYDYAVSHPKDPASAITLKKLGF